MGALRRVLGALPVLRELRDYVRHLERRSSEAEASLLESRLENAVLRASHGAWPPGHFYSPIPSADDIARGRDQLFGPAPAGLPGIDLNVDGQLALLEELSVFGKAAPLERSRGPAARYGWGNDAFGPSDGTVLHCMLRRFRPARLVEIGSGHSTCVVLDARERYLGGLPELTLVEPDPACLLSLIRPGDLERFTLLSRSACDVDPSVFGALRAGDVLFIDSSHVSRIGSDVNHLLLEIVPSLAPGVLVHVHDVYYPFEYPVEPGGGGVFWNEAYLLRALLVGNRALEILFFMSYLKRLHTALLEDRLPLCADHHGGSLWMRTR